MNRKGRDMHTQLCIDMGGANLLASVVGEGIVLRDPSVIAQDRESGKVLAVGAAAEQKLNMPGSNVALSRPFGSGMTASPDITAAVLSSCMIAAGGAEGKSDLLLSVPCDLTDVQEELLVGVAKEIGARSCHLIYAPLAAMAGTFLNMPRGCLTVDIGATATHVMLLCRGRIYYMKTIPTGGQAFDRAIAAYMQRRRKVHISLRTAETIKTTIGTVWAPTRSAEMEVQAKDANGKPVTVRVTSTELYDALEEPIGTILEAVWIAVSKIPTEYVECVFELGIQLCGGGSKLDGIDRMIGGVTGVATHRVEDPMGCTALGLAEIMAQLPQDIPPAFHNVSEIYIKHIYAGSR
jgi:rod shape-determining protein MreB